VEKEITDFFIYSGLFKDQVSYRISFNLEGKKYELEQYPQNTFKDLSMIETDISGDFNCLDSSCKNVDIKIHFLSGKYKDQNLIIHRKFIPDIEIDNTVSYNLGNSVNMDRYWNYRKGSAIGQSRLELDYTTIEKTPFCELKLSVQTKTIERHGNEQAKKLTMFMG